ncbi:MBL fold metallo-hydrolase [Parasphingopyxis algicola]|uniref:MBL fold metallo-hydrolase n=1 Tax=Parasphingopyxis algicola TaxID=2026624 RepID=UPI0015A43A10|nr:MBL fold metallo-hydrolase [Parasphingopyxis algicola]QLC26431.1 MBL fold metallo-hydrolase [Parasphingopyxis algicola]
MSETTTKRPPWPRRIVLAVFVVFLVAAGVIGVLVWTADDRLDGVFIDFAQARLEPQHRTLFSDDDTLRVFVCGSSSPFATPDRAKTCIGVIANGEILLFDTGAGSWRNIENWQLQTDRVAHVFFTHFHSDHIADLDEVNVQSWIWGRRTAIRVHGPSGVERVVAGYNEALALDYGYRNDYGEERYFPHAAATMIANPIESIPGRAVPVYENGNLRILAFPVDHAPVEPAFGYVIEYGDRRVVISGDTRRADLTERLARDADILFHEAQSRRLSHIMATAAERSNDARMQFVMTKAGDYHTAAEDFAELARETNATRVIMYHLAPPPDALPLQRVFLRNMPDNVSLAFDGQLFELPLQGREIREGRIEAP